MGGYGGAMGRDRGGGGMGRGAGGRDRQGILGGRMAQAGQQMMMPPRQQQQMMAPQGPQPNLGLLNQQQFTPGGLLQGYDLGGALMQRFGRGAVSPFRY